MTSKRPSMCLPTAPSVDKRKVKRVRTISQITTTSGKQNSKITLRDLPYKVGSSSNLIQNIKANSTNSSMIRQRKKTATMSEHSISNSNTGLIQTNLNRSIEDIRINNMKSDRAMKQKKALAAASQSAYNFNKRNQRVGINVGKGSNYIDPELPRSPKFNN